jgi:adenosylmethionine-8-amino-7-oxononanoate aminotransferase
MAALRHIGRLPEYVTGKVDGKWQLADGTSLRDLSGGPLVQSMLNLPHPPHEVFETIGPPGGIETALREELEKAIISLAGPQCNGILWATSGSDAIEQALWAGQQTSSKALSSHQTYIVRQGSYHGSTFLTRWLSTRLGYLGNSPKDSTRMVFQEELGQDGCEAETADHVIEQLQDLDPDSRIILILEPVPTTGRVFWPGIQFYRKLLTWARKRGIFVIMDEVASGVYRHGWFSSFNWDLPTNPDAVVLAKGLTCGAHPLSCVLLSRETAGQLQSQGDRPPTFTQGLNDAAAWWAKQCLEQFANLGQQGFFADRKRLMADQLAPSLSSMNIPTAIVESTDTTVRLALKDQTLWQDLSRAFREHSLQTYESKARFGSEDFYFFLICPAFDMPSSIIKEAFADLITAVRAVL